MQNISTDIYIKANTEIMDDAIDNLIEYFSKI